MKKRDYVKEREQQKIWRAKNKDKIKKYYEENKDKFLGYRKKYHESHKEEIRKRKKKYYSDPNNAAKKAERGKELYELNKEKVLERHAGRRQERKAFIDKISLYYGCRNPNCQWNGKFEPCQLDFHHFKSETKCKEVSKMHSSSYENIIAEINKCVVVCRNCHMLVHHGDVVLTEDMICKSQDSFYSSFKT